jgi:hypothetical protein
MDIQFLSLSLRRVSSAVKSSFVFLLLLIGAILCFPEINSSIAAAASFPASSSPNPKFVEGYGTVPLSFEANRGQVDPRVRFLSRGQGYTLFLTSREAVLSLSKAGAEPAAIVSLQLAGGNRRAAIVEENELPGKANYFIGNDPAKWRTNVPTYARVRYRDVYPGIDLVYYGNQRRLEHDFVVAPGADPSRIKLRLRGVQGLRIDQGALVMSTAQGELRLLKPVIYQQVNGERRQVSGRYVLQAGNQVGFALAQFDRSQPLIVDPVLSYSTYLGGIKSDSGNGIAVDSSGNAYVAGGTSSSNFPTLNPIEGSLHGTDYGDAFVAKFSANGTLVYSTYLGGDNQDAATAIAVDSSGNAYITGGTSSSGFPTINAYQPSLQGNSDAFVAKLNATGSALLYSTFLGGSLPGGAGTEAKSIAIDSSGNAYITGDTNATNLPIINGPYNSLENPSTMHAFVAKFNTSGSLVYSTYLEGDSDDHGNGIDVDNTGNIYVTGQTESDDFPTTSGAFQTAQTLTGFIFVTKLNPNGIALPLVYSTYLGNAGNGDGSATGIAVDRSSGKAYVTGYARAYGDGIVLPVSTNAYQKTNNGGVSSENVNSYNAFVTALTADGSGLLYSTYLGGSKFSTGSSGDQAKGITLDSAGNAYITGFASSTDFPTVNAIQSSNNAAAVKGNDAFAAELSTDGSALIFSTYLGGSGGGDQGNAIAVDSAGGIYVTGQTDSSDFPTVNAFQSSYANKEGFGNAFVAKIGTTSTNPVLSVNPSTLAFAATVNGTNPAGQPIAIANTGTGTLNWTASYTSTWLSLDSSSGAAPSTIHAYVNTAGMATGTYKDTITITASGASPATIAVTLTVTDFTLSADTSSLNLQRGQSGTVHLTVTPLNGFNQTVSFACSGLPTGATCSFSPPTVTSQGSAVKTQLTVSVPTTVSQRRRGILPWSAASVMLAFCTLGFSKRGRRKWLPMLLLISVIALGGLLVACGGGFAPPTPATSSSAATIPPSTVTVTATSGQLQHSTSFTLTVQ